MLIFIQYHSQMQEITKERILDDIYKYVAATTGSNDNNYNYNNVYHFYLLSLLCPALEVALSLSRRGCPVCVCVWLWQMQPNKFFLRWQYFLVAKKRMGQHVLMLMEKYWGDLENIIVDNFMAIRWKCGYGWVTWEVSPGFIPKTVLTFLIFGLSFR